MLSWTFKNNGSRCMRETMTENNEKCGVHEAAGNAEEKRRDHTETRVWTAEENKYNTLKQLSLGSGYAPENEKRMKTPLLRLPLRFRFTVVHWSDTCLRSCSVVRSSGGPAKARIFQEDRHLAGPHQGLVRAGPASSP